MEESRMKRHNDAVSSPSHYTDGKIEVIEFIMDKDMDFCIGNVVKYVSRAGKKDEDKYIEDLEKARQYLDFKINYLKTGNPHGIEGEEENPNYSIPSLYYVDIDYADEYKNKIRRHCSVMATSEAEAKNIALMHTRPKAGNATMSVTSCKELPCWCGFISDVSGDRSILTKYMDIFKKELGWDPITQHNIALGTPANISEDGKKYAQLYHDLLFKIAEVVRQMDAEVQ